MRKRGSLGRSSMAFLAISEERMTSGAPVEQITMSNWLIILGKFS